MAKRSAPSGRWRRGLFSAPSTIGRLCLPISAAPQDAVAAGLLDACWNRLYADPQFLAEYPPELAEGLQEFVQAGDMARIAQPIDWFGLNHYCPIYARADQGPLGFAWADAPHDVPLTGVGWRIDPEAFRDELIADAPALQAADLRHGEWLRRQRDAG